jgi:hypothetical protein
VELEACVEDMSTSYSTSCEKAKLVEIMLSSEVWTKNFIPSSSSSGSSNPSLEMEH